MRKKEIVILDCGVEVRIEPQGVMFSSIDSGREFAFGIRNEEIADMISYLQSVHSYHDTKLGDASATNIVAVREMTPVEKAAQRGVTAGHLAPPASVPTGGRVVAASIHK